MLARWMFVLGTLRKLILLIGSVLIRTILVLRVGSVWILLIKGILVLLPWHLRSISAIGLIWRNARDLAWLRRPITLFVTSTRGPRRLSLIAKSGRLTVE